MAVGHNITELSPERATPEEMAGRLMESEHRGRYLWAAQLAEGHRVLDAGCGTGYGTEILDAAGAAQTVGVDISQEAVDYARSSCSGQSEFVQGGLHELPFDDDSFGLAVCFEVIEHVDDQQAAIAELRRVLTPEGLLVISSPNRNVYPPGNPYHTHEFTPEELEHSLRAEFSGVRLYRQSPWLAAAVLDDQQSQATGASSELLLKTIKIAPVAPGDEVFTIALASNGELPDPASVALIGEPFEVRWWEQKLDQAAGERDRALSDRDRAGAGRDSARAERDLERKEQGAALLEVEAELAQAHDRIAQLSSSAADLEQWSVEQLGERDMLLGEREQESLDYKNRLGRAEATIEDVTTSISWRLTRPLRAVKKLLG